MTKSSMPESESTFFSHLDELRSAMLHIIVALLICWPIGYFVTSYCMNWLIEWCCPPAIEKLNYFSPMEGFLAELKLSFIIAAIISYPYNIWKIWQFLLPALYPKERRALKWWLCGATLLFVGGATFCIGLIIPMVMEFSSSFANDNIQATLGLSNFLNLVGWMILAFGIMFQFPLLTILVVRFNLISYTALKNKRPYVIVGILALAAILTPPDVLSQLLLAIPTYLLFELGLLLTKYSLGRSTE